MPNVKLLVHVELQSGKRDEYLAITESLRSHFKGTDGVEYAVYENKTKSGNLFTEIFTFRDEETFDAFDERDDQQADELFGQIIAIANGSPKYTTLTEIGN